MHQNSYTETINRQEQFTNDRGVDFTIYCETNYKQSEGMDNDVHTLLWGCALHHLHYRCTCWGGRRGLKDRTWMLGWFLKALFGL